MAAGQTVSVGCKLPHGIHCQLYSIKPGEPAQALGPRVTLKGANQVVNESMLVVPPGSFGVTENVDKDFIEKWLKDNASLECVKAGHIFINEKRNNVEAEGKAKKTVKTGLEGLDPKALPPGIESITKDS